ncbi:MAG: NADPH-dependent FMN reductase [Ilumatobacter sp.]|uniref:NADPH-dependent FMN reductase n=1 Tax=Ilumatobacter sp. TaxID=1967498 RepID=UPI0032971657
MSDVRLLGLVGSLRTASVNAATARAVSASMPDGVSLHVYDVRDVPLYHGDDDQSGPPAPVTALREAIRAADGIVLFSPEYNSSLPAVTKNIIDWLSRDPSTWASTGITMVVMSPGGRAGASVREHFEAIMSRQATRLFPTIGFGNYATLLDDQGELTDRATLDRLARFLAEFAEFCATPPAAS